MWAAAPGCSPARSPRLSSRSVRCCVSTRRPPCFDRSRPPPRSVLPVQASAEDLATRRVTLPYAPLDAVWMKEAIHHVTDPAATVGGLASLLGPGGRFLVVMLPARIEYPLFAAALSRYESLQPDPTRIADHMAAAGLRTSLSIVEHQVRLPAERYLSMVRARYMSVLATFTEEEIEAGVQEIRARHPGPELVFPDRFVFILGSAAAGSASGGTR